MAQYAAALQREFPTSIYAKLIADPLYREHQAALHNAVAVRVDSAFTHYKNQRFTKAAAVLARTEKQYPKSDLADRVAYLKTLLIIRTQPPLTARTSVERFYKNYPDSPLAPQAQALAETYRKQGSGQIAGALASTEKPVISIFRPGEVDNRLRIQYRENETPAKALNPNQPAPIPAKDVPKDATKLPSGAAPKTEVLAPNGTAVPAPTTATPFQPAPSPTAATPPKAAPTGAASASAPAPGTTAPATPLPTSPSGAAPGTAPAPIEAPATAYTTLLSSPHAVVLVFPKAAPAAADLPTQLGTYNNRFFKANNLQIETPSLGADQNLVVVRALPGAKVAQSYATKLRGPQSPLARLRGAGYQTLVISMENLALLQATGDLAGYLTFYQRVYK
ncbi:hypothetical protein ACFQT0_02800 [Hymenobacter humi]|uniref:SPOR domain-containing protein n=1 Tax=Hymenobacter humi TaxID=1411620 RepID=A0ABW2U0S1_9BACT